MTGSDWCSCEVDLCELYVLVVLVETTVHWSSIMQQVKRPNRMASITRNTTRRLPAAEEGPGREGGRQRRGQAGREGGG